MRNRWFLLALVAMLVCGRSFAEGKIVNKEDGAMRVLCYNVHAGVGMDGKLDFDRTCDVIVQFSADMVAMQELDSATNRSGGLSTGEEYAKRLGMNFTFAPAISFGGGKYGVGLLSKEKPIAYNYYPLPGREEERVLLIVEFKECYMAVSHLSLTEEDRVVAAEIITKKVKKLKDKPTILCGDFNAEPDSEAIRLLSESFYQLSDPANHTFPVVNPYGTIDYIMGSKRGYSYRVAAHDVISETIASDHLPLFVDLIISEK